MFYRRKIRCAFKSFTVQILCIFSVFNEVHAVGESAVITLEFPAGEEYVCESVYYAISNSVFWNLQRWKSL